MNAHFLRNVQKAFVVLSVFLVYACAIVESEPSKIEKTYPAAGDYDPVILKVLIDSEAQPGSFNLQAYVVSINECPKEYACFAPDGITLSVTRHVSGKEDQYHLSAQKPSQFEMSREYVFSIKIEDAGFKHPDTGKPVQRVRLLGYD